MTKVLCFKKDQLKIDISQPFNGIATPDHLDGLKYELLDRPACETMFDYMQVIPYVTLYDDKGRIFVYQRGDAGGEGRLHGKCSLGLGGHVEEMVTAEKSFISVIADAISRELEEEVGLPITEKRTKLYHARMHEKNFMCLIDNTNDVGRVHLGLSMFVRVNPEELGAHEKSVIERGKWMTPEELLEVLNKDDGVVLENWSVTVMKAIVEKYNIK